MALGSIFDIFRGGNNSPSPGNSATSANPGGENPNQTTNPTVPSSSTPVSDGSVKAIPATGQGEKSPLDQYKELWKTDPNKEGSNQGQPTLVPQFQLDPSKVVEAAGKIDFLSSIPEALLQEAMSDPAKMREVLNNGLRSAFANAAITSGNLIQNSMGTAQDVLKSQILPEAYRTQAIQANLAANPVFQNPAVAPLLDVVRQQLQQKYPTASPKEISDHALEYFTGISTQVVQSTGGQIQRPGDSRGNSRGMLSRNQEFDWSTWLEADGQGRR